jgi:hypothetical protein
MADTVQYDSRHRVAFDLAVRIAHEDGTSKKDGTYWLKLYDAALSAVNNMGASESIAKLPK